MEKVLLEGRFRKVDPISESLLCFVSGDDEKENYGGHTLLVTTKVPAGTQVKVTVWVEDAED